MTKSKSGMVTEVITHLLTDTLPVLVIKRAFSPLGTDTNPQVIVENCPFYHYIKECIYC